MKKWSTPNLSEVDFKSTEVYCGPVHYDQPSGGCQPYQPGQPGKPGQPGGRGKGGWGC